ncbi:ATP-binding protein [Undibacterium fentianense]|uniref:histidine kinase n=1 Tax=Undibacterium fentianense TaxID=2828728 RepID=A0A941IH46_9BURK|nr:ATP-binding protein [Undibacterium fentianense]MBR7800625.1 GAF domain-containing protein [Undibacterium fentianense]
MNEILQRIEQCSRRHPKLAIRMFEGFEHAALKEERHSLALNALVKRFFVCERLGLASSLNDALFAGLQTAEHLGLPYQAGKIMLCVGRIRYTQGVYKEAIRFWTRCIDLCRVTHDAEVLIEARIGLGQIYDALGDWETGARFHRYAGELLTTFDRPYLKSKQAINLGVNSMNMGQRQLAKELFLEAIVQAERGGVAEYVAEAHWHLGVLAYQEAQFDLALMEVKKAIHLAERCDYAWLLGAASNTLGEILIARGNTDTAIQTYLNALSHAEKIGSRQQRALCCNALSHLYETTGQAQLALNFARTHHQLVSEIADSSVIDKFRELREYDLSRKPPVELLLDLSSNSQLEEKSLSEALRHICDESLKILQVDSICLWLKDKQQLRCEMISGELPFRFQVGKCLEQKDFLKYFQVIQNLHTPVAIHDLRIHPAAAELTELYQDAGLHSLLEISVRLHGQQVGVISFGKAHQRKNWTREYLLFGSHIANLIQQMISHEEYRQAQSRLENRVAERTQELQERTELLRTAHQNIFILSEIGREITSQLDRESIIQTLYQHLHKLIPAELLSVGIYKAEQGMIDFPCNVLSGVNLLPFHRSLQDPDLLSVWCVQHRRPIYINDIHEDYLHYVGIEGLDKLVVSEAFDGQHLDFAPLSMIYVPLIVKDRVLGLLSMQSSQRYAFERMHVDMLTTLAAYTAVAFDNADTYQQLSSAQQLLMSKEKLAALGALVAGIAHEINTPLGNCLLTATTLKENSRQFVEQFESGTLKRSGFLHFTEVLTEANEMLLRNLVNASELISSFKQVSVDQTSQQRRTFNLLKTSQEIVRTMQSRISKHGHHITIDISDKINIDSYPGPYGQVITNFINNALLHGFENRDSGTMQLSAEIFDKQHVKICFSDDGNGIRPEHLRRVFDPFFTTKLGHGGSGLGMNIVHNIVTDLLGGSIAVDSEIDVGTRITLILPIAVNAESLQ